MNLGDLLRKSGVATGKINAITQRTIRKLIRSGKVAPGGKITCSEAEFADIAVSCIPKTEMKRIAKESK